MKKLLLILAGLVAVIAGVGLLPLRPPAFAEGARVSVDGVAVRYVQRGAGPDVLLIHGMAGTAEDWEALMPLLTPHHRVTAVDLLGQGGSDLAPGAHNIAGNARAIARLAERLKLSDVVVVGHSYGGAIALKLATDAWPRARGYVLLAPATRPIELSVTDRVAAVPVFGLGLARIAQPFVGEGMIRSGLAVATVPDGASFPAGFVDIRVQRWNRGAMLHAYSQQHVAFNRELAEIGRHYGAITRPMLILQGDRDEYRALIEGSRALAQAVPHARLIELPGAGHYLQYKDPQAVMTVVAAVRR